MTAKTPPRIAALFTGAAALTTGSWSAISGTVPEALFGYLGIVLAMFLHYIGEPARWQRATQSARRWRDSDPSDKGLAWKVKREFMRPYGAAFILSILIGVPLVIGEIAAGDSSGDVWTTVSLVLVATIGTGYRRSRGR